MPSPPPRKTRQEFPPAEGWVRVENERTVPIHVMIEPWGLGHDLAPGESCHVHLLPGAEGLLRLSDGFCVVWCGDAIYQSGAEIWDFQD